MAKLVRMLATHCEPGVVLDAGKLYYLDDKTYRRLAKCNSPGNPIFDNNPTVNEGEKKLGMNSTVPDPEDKKDQNPDGAKLPEFTATDAEAGVAPKQNNPLTVPLRESVKPEQPKEPVK